MQFLSADFIFDGYTFLPENTILILQDDGIIHDIVQDEHIEQVKHMKGLLLPGLVNAHCHLELSHLKGAIAEHGGLVNFLLTVNKTRDLFTQQQILDAIETAENEMRLNGIVAVGDISNNNNTLFQKQQNNLCYHTFVECFGLLDANAKERFEAAEKVYNEFAKVGDASIVLHAPYSVSATLIELVNAISSGRITTIHNQECADENNLFRLGEGTFLHLFKAILNDTSFFKPSGKSSLQTYLPSLHHQEKIILVHNTFTSAEDIVCANSLSKELYWCLCPNANLYIEQTLPDIEMMMKKNCIIVLGTDSLASNHSLNILDEILTIQKLKPAISLEEKLKWATSNGAKALGMNTQLGSFQKGKKPGIIQFSNMTNKNELPVNPIIHLL